MMLNGVRTPLSLTSMSMDQADLRSAIAELSLVESTLGYDRPMLWGTLTRYAQAHSTVRSLCRSDGYICSLWSRSCRVYCNPRLQTHTSLFKKKQRHFVECKPIHLHPFAKLHLCMLKQLPFFSPACYHLFIEA